MEYESPILPQEHGSMEYSAAATFARVRGMEYKAATPLRVYGSMEYSTCWRLLEYRSMTTLYSCMGPTERAGQGWVRGRIKP